VLRILHTNDSHGTLPSVLPSLRELRAEADVYFDSGDCIKAGNLAVPLKQDPAWEALADLACDASVLGNRETHVLEAAFRMKIAGHLHPLLCGNLRRKDGTRPLARSHIIERSGVRIGLLGVMVPMVTERMRSQAASAYLWDPPIPTAQELAEELRPQVDLLVALTHIGHREDVRLAEACPRLDAIFGGHSHTVLHEPMTVGGTAICQGGAHSRFAGIYRWDGERLSGSLLALR
jgi:5'-nucleotidase